MKFFKKFKSEDLIWRAERRSGVWLFFSKILILLFTFKQIGLIRSNASKKPNKNQMSQPKLTKTHSTQFCPAISTTLTLWDPFPQPKLFYILKITKTKKNDYFCDLFWIILPNTKLSHFCYIQKYGKYCILIESKFSRNIHFDLDFNLIFDYVHGMHCLNVLVQLFIWKHNVYKQMSCNCVSLYYFIYLNK